MVHSRYSIHFTSCLPAAAADVMCVCVQHFYTVSGGAAFTVVVCVMVFVPCSDYVGGEV